MKCGKLYLFTLIFGLIEDFLPIISGVFHIFNIFNVENFFPFFDNSRNVIFLYEALCSYRVER